MTTISFLMCLGGGVRGPVLDVRSWSSHFVCASVFSSIKWVVMKPQGVLAWRFVACGADSKHSIRAVMMASLLPSQEGSSHRSLCLAST